MVNGFDILPARNGSDVEDVARLFGRYAQTAPIDLGYQDFDAELAGLPGKYAPPRGSLLLARDERGAAVGCVGMRPLRFESGCEMKRLFILPSARGSGLGRALARAAIEHARALGYEEMRLDTLPTMTAAIALYEDLGFRTCPAYYAPTPPDTIFMAISL